MKGARPLTDQEIIIIYDKGFEGEYDLRNQVLFILRLKTGLRVSEALSVTLSDVVQSDGTIRDRIYVERRKTKGKVEGRSIVLHPQVKLILNLFLTTIPRTQEYLFAGNKGGTIDKRSVWRIEREACIRVGIDPKKVGTHSTRKTFAKKVHEKLKDVIKTQKALGHKDLNSTVKYLTVDEDEVDDAILSV